MRPARRTFYALVALFGLIDLAELYWTTIGNEPTVPGIVVLAVLFVQVSLLAAWAGVGAAPWAMRLTGLVVGAAVLSLVLARTAATARDAVASLFLAQVTIVTGTLALVRSFHLRVRQMETAAETNNSSAGSAITQFSIKEMMFWVASAALYLGVGKFLGLKGSFLLEQTSGMMQWTACNATVCLAAVWATRDGRRPWLRYSLLGIVATVPGGMQAWQHPQRWSYLFDFVAVNVTHAILLTLLLQVLRANGFMLGRQEPSSPLIGQVGPNVTMSSP